MRLVFCVESGIQAALTAAIRSAGLGLYLELGEIEIWPVTERRRLLHAVRWESVRDGDVFVRSKGVYLSEIESYSAKCSIAEKSIRPLVDQKRALTNLLEKHGFTWERAVLRELSKWNHSQISLPVARDWLDQFRIIGRPDIGKTLLTGIRVVGGTQLKSRFPLEELRAETDRQVAVLSSIDESGGTLAHLMRR